MSQDSSRAGARDNDDGELPRMQKFLSRLLLYGVLLSTSIIIIGLILMGVTNVTGYGCDSAKDSLNCILSYNSNLIPHGDYPNNLFALASGLVQLKPFSVIQLGVVVLLATPVLRVFSSLVLFAAGKDRAFVFITVFVLAMLLFSFFVAPLIPLFKA